MGKYLMKFIGRSKIVCALSFIAASGCASNNLATARASNDVAVDECSLIPGVWQGIQDYGHVQVSYQATLATDGSVTTAFKISEEGQAPRLDVSTGSWKCARGEFSQKVYFYSLGETHYYKYRLIKINDELQKYVLLNTEDAGREFIAYRMK